MEYGLNYLTDTGFCPLRMKIYTDGLFLKVCECDGGWGGWTDDGRVADNQVK